MANGNPFGSDPLNRRVLPKGIPAGRYLFGPQGMFSEGITAENRALAQDEARKGVVAAFQKKVIELSAMGKSPQAALVQALNTPEGQEFFNVAGDDLKTVTEALRGALVPPTEIRGPGQETTEVGTGRVLGSTPPSDIQTLRGMAQMAGYEEGSEDFKAIARAQLGAAGTTEKERATRWLVNQGVLTELEGNKSLAGQLVVQPVSNFETDPATGQTRERFLGVSITDLTNGTNRFIAANQLPQGVQAAVARAPVQEGAARPGAPVEQPTQGLQQQGLQQPPLPARKPTPPALGAEGLPEAGAEAAPGAEAPKAVATIFGEGTDPSIMFAGAGLVPALIDVLGSIGEQIDPRLSAGLVTNQRAAIRNLRTAALGLTSSNNSRLKIVAEELLSTLPSTGVLEGPQSAIRTTLEFQDRLMKLRKEQSEVFQQNRGADARSTKLRQAADADINAIDTALAAMPTKEQMVARLKLFEEGKGGAFTPAQAMEIFKKSGARLMEDLEGTGQGSALDKLRSQGPSAVTLQDISAMDRNAVRTFVLGASAEELDALPPEVRALIKQKATEAPK